MHDPPHRYITAPKRLQRESPEEAAGVYAEKYREALAADDRFLSEMYLDELAASVILAHSLVQTKQARSAYWLKGQIHGLIGELPSEQRRLFEEDLELALSKRYPEDFKAEEVAPPPG